MFFTGASMVAAVTSILAGASSALLLDAAGVPLAAAVVAGAATAFAGVRPAHAVDVSPGAAGDDLMIRAPWKAHQESFLIMLRLAL
jgi:hypothetical protein